MNMYDILCTFLSRQSLPKGMDSFHKVIFFLWLHHTSQICFHGRPNIFNGIKVWRWGRCHHHIFKNPLFLHPLFCWLLVCFLSLSLEKKVFILHLFWYLYWTVSADFKFCIIYKHMLISKVLLICILLKYEPNVKYKGKLVTLVCFTNVKQKGKQIKSINWYFWD